MPAPTRCNALYAVRPPFRTLRTPVVVASLLAALCLSTAAATRIALHGPRAVYAHRPIDLRVTIAPDDRNRALVVVVNPDADDGLFSSTARMIDGADTPPTIWLHWPAGLPGGDYHLTAGIADARGAILVTSAPLLLHVAQP